MSRPRRSLSRAVAALALCPLLVALAAPATASATATASGIVCTTYHAGAGTASVRYGYSNVGATSSAFETVTELGDDFFSPPPLERGQPLQLVAGNGSFDLTFAAGTEPAPAWTINGTTETPDLAVADLPFERPCPERGPSISAVSPIGLAPGASGRDLTVFGQGLAGASVAVSGGGVSVGAPTASSEQRLDATVHVAPGAAAGPRDVLVTDGAGNEVGCRGCLTIGAGGEVSGPPGPPGPRGEAGPPGASAASSASHVTAAERLGRHGEAAAVARCRAGSVAIAGGYRLAGYGKPAALSVLADGPKGTRGWAVAVKARGARKGQRLVVSVTCLAG